MIVTIHQPHLLPWLGYFDRMRKADLFILLDDVQFERQNYQNRVRIKTGQGPQWIIVPVHQRSQEERIGDKTIDNQREGRHRWGRKAFLSLKYAYQGAPYFRDYAGLLKEVLDARWEKLVDLDLLLIDFLRQALEIKTPMVRSSELKVPGQKSELVLGLCKAVGADAFLGGLGGSRAYLDEEAFREAGIRVEWQSFQHPRYEQHPCPERFIEGLTALDLLFNCGPESAALLRRELSAAAP